MIRIACLFGLVALAALGILVARGDGASSIAFSFVGLPALAVAMGLYGLHRLRAGPSSLPRRPEKEHPMRPLFLLPALLVFAAATVAGAADGAGLYKQHCASCHGETGLSDTPVGKVLKAPPLAGDATVAGMADADLQAKIAENAKHKAFIQKLSADDVAAVATYVKGLAGE